MWGYLRRKRELLRDQERVRHLISMRAKDHRGLTRQDFVNFGAALSLRPYLLHAFYAVESAGSGFDSSGRLKILYEPHVVSRNTGRRLDKMRFPWIWQGQETTVRLSYPKWINPARVPRKDWHPYRENETGQWEMLATTYELEENALMGASYGGFQILGENAVPLGYHDPLHMIETMYEGEFAQIEAAIRFLRWKNLFGELQAGNFERIARVWNGSGNVPAFTAKFAQKVDTLRKVYA